MLKDSIIPKMGSHSGIPIGAVQLGAAHMNSFRELLNRTLFAGRRTGKNKCKLCFRGVQPFIGPRNRDQASSSRLLLIHVPPAVAMALDDGHPDLLKFLEQHNGVYSPGLRRSRTLSCAKRRTRAAVNMPKYVRPQSASPSTGSGSESNGPAFTFSELFAGIGGFRLGLEEIRGKCVFANEINPYASSIYRAHFDSSDCHVEADILDLCAKTDIPADVDILTAGFPCQPFSTRGKQKGLEDNERGQMYREIVRVLLDSRPKSFIFENVSGLVTMGSSKGGGPRLGKACGDAGPVFQTMLRAFEDCGYDITWNLCNSRHYVAQQRERVFIVGLRTDLKHRAFSWDWYEKLVEGASKADAALLVVRGILEPPDSAAVSESEITPNQWTKLQEIHSNRDGGITNAIIDIDAKAPTLISSYRSVNNHTSKFILHERDGTKRKIPRFLTPREALRIQGFPESFYVPSCVVDGEVGVAHFYSGIGNAVVPQIVSDIGRELVGCLRS